LTAHTDLDAREALAERLVDATTHALETLGVYLGLELALHQALATFAGVARLRPRSSSTGSPTRSPTRTGRLALSRATPGRRVDRQRARTAIERVQAKQRAAG
jgi:hypothetical protein